MINNKENYELYKAGYKAQAERIKELEKEVRELRSVLKVASAALQLGERSEEVKNDRY